MRHEYEVELELTVAFTSIGATDKALYHDGRSWRGTAFKRMVTLPFPPFIGMQWSGIENADAYWPMDYIKIREIVVYDNSVVSCRCRLIDECIYDNIAQIRESYEEGGWEEDEDSQYLEDLTELPPPGWAD